MALDLADPLGVDIGCIDDVDASLTLVSGNTEVGHAIARRIATPRGRLFYAPTYGADARGRVGRPFHAGTIQREVEQECMKDERVEDVRARVTFTEHASDADDVQDEAVIDIVAETAAGPFVLVGTLGAGSSNVTITEVREDR